MDGILRNFRDQILAATANRTAITIRGGNTKSWYGNVIESASSDVIDTSAYRGVVAYEPTELVITAKCGTPLNDIENLLDQHGQMLAFEPPHFGETATLGGMVAAGLAGPRRASVGAVKDFVLGAHLMNGQAQYVQFGGQVMKNVAGYDVSRLMAGSLGSLGLILQVSLKLLPKPMAETSLCFAVGENDAIRMLNTWAGQALPISASSYHAGRMLVRLSGSEAALRLAKQKLGGQELDQAQRYWHDLREQQDAFFTPDGEHVLWRLSLPSVVPALSLRGKTLIEWGGAQRWLWTNESADHVRTTVQKLGGHATMFRYAQDQGNVFASLGPAHQKIHAQLKCAFDPAGIFNPGRLFGGA